MKRKRRYFVFNIVALGLLAVMGGILEGAAANTIPSRYLPYIWPALIVVALAIIGCSIWQYRLQEGSEQLPLNIQNRLRLIEKVCAFWIKGVLEQSLHNEALIALGLHEQPDAVANPWHLVLQQQDQTKRPLPAGTRITEVYDDSGGELLILGEPGSGKTTLLLELAHDLLNRAQKDDNLQIPVVYNLSSWAVKRQALTDWLVDELNTKYQVPRKLGQSWIDGDQILPLLDGLDEVKEEYREECLKFINTYRQEHGIVPTVVCSRTTEYFDQRKRVHLRSAVIVQPLIAQQIDDYLSSAGGQLATIRVALRDDADLREMAKTPLMLHVLTLAYYGKSIEDILIKGSFETQRRQVFATYIERILQRRGNLNRYTSKQFMHWMVSLAKYMTQHKQTEFYIEQIQQDWLTISWCGLFLGGAAFVAHFVLRFFLWRSGCMPWNYPRFLDYAADRILLRKVGGGYIFIHRMLLEYFASLDTSPTSTP